MKIRRIVMGHAGGRSVVLQDDAVEPLTVAMLPGAEIHRLWELDEPASVPVTEVKPVSAERIYPLPGGLRFGTLTIPAGLSYELPADVDVETALAEAEAKLPGMAAAQGAPAGQKVFETNKCALCHSVAGKGNAKGPLDGVGSKLEEDEIRMWLMDPDAMAKKIKSTRKPVMKSYAKLPKEDIDALAEYMDSLKKQ